jgi:hypothetical protein
VFMEMLAGAPVEVECTPMMARRWIAAKYDAR